MQTAVSKFPNARHARLFELIRQQNMADADAHLSHFYPQDDIEMVKRNAGKSLFRDVDLNAPSTRQHVQTIRRSRGN